PKLLPTSKGTKLPYGMSWGTIPCANDSRVVFVLVPLLGALIPSSPLCSPGRPAPLRRYPTSSCAACPAPATVARHRAPPCCSSRRWPRAARVEGTRVKSGSVLPIRAVKAMISKAVETYGRLNCAHNNAGIGSRPRAPLHECTEEIWDRALGINLKG